VDLADLRLKLSDRVHLRGIDSWAYMMKGVTTGFGNGGSVLEVTFSPACAAGSPVERWKVNLKSILSHSGREAAEKVASCPFDCENEDPHRLPVPSFKRVTVSWYGIRNP